MGVSGSPRVELADVRARALGAMLGLAVGDALGATVEFLTPSEIHAKYGVHCKMIGGGWLQLKPGGVTDDTEMSRCIARSLAGGTWSPRDVAERFAAWFRTGPVDVGNTCRRGIARYINHGTLAGLPNEGDAGNGAAMRMTPVALATLGDCERLRQWSVEQGHITHHHPLSDQACVLVGQLIQLGCASRPKEFMRAKVERTLADAPKFRFTPYHGLSTAYVVDTMQTVLHFFFTTGSFEDCLVATVNQGGDADTTGAIVGAIAGAHYGPSAIPSRWTRKLKPALLAVCDTYRTRVAVNQPLLARHNAL